MNNRGKFLTSRFQTVMSGAETARCGARRLFAQMSDKWMWVFGRELRLFCKTLCVSDRLMRLAVLLMVVCASVLTANRAQAANVGLGDDKADLQAYYEEVENYYSLMTDSTYDDKAFTSEQQRALKTALDKALNTLLSSTGDYAAVLSELKGVYERVPYVAGGKKWWGITAADLKDGSTIMLEPAHTDYQGRFVVAYPDRNNANCVMADDRGKQAAALWQLEATGQNDPIYTSKPTYYLKHVNSGKYFGVSDNLNSIDQNHKRMVDDKEMAYSFCILSIDEVKAEQGISINGYGNKDAVVVQHSNTDGTWFRLTRFGGYTQVYYMSSSYYPTNTMWPAWNLYTGESTLNIAGELEQAIADWTSLSHTGGTAPGCYDQSAVDAYAAAVAQAKAITPNNTRQQYRTAIDALDSAYHKLLALKPYPVAEGYYRIVSANQSFVSQNKSVCVYDRGDGYLGFHEMDTTHVGDVFKIEAAEGGWYVRNCATQAYVDKAIDANRITMAATPTVVQVFTFHDLGQWKWKNTATTYTYYTNGSAPGYVGRYYQQNSLNSFDDWVFQQVSKEWVDKAVLGPAIDSLKAYYNKMLADVAPYAKTPDYSAEAVTAFNTAMDEAKQALNSAQSLTTDRYKALLSNLKEAYAALGFAQGGGAKVVGRIPVSQIGDGTLIALEAASTPNLSNYFLKGQTAYRHELYSWVFKPGLDKDGVWEVVAANKPDLKNSKPTYYLRQHSTGLYVGKNGVGAAAYQTRALVQTTDSAYNFSLLTTDEAGCTDYYGVKNWDSQSVVFQYANTAEKSFNLCNWEYSPTFVWLFETSTDVIAWNAYQVELSDNLQDEFDKLMARCNALQPEKDSGIGFYDADLVSNYYQAYDAAKNLGESSSRLDYRHAMDRLDSAWLALNSAGVAAPQSGYYFMTNRSEDYLKAYGAYAALRIDSATQSVGYGRFRRDSYASVVHITGNEGAWYLQCFANDKFLTAAKDGTLSLSDNRTTTFNIRITDTYKANLRAAGQGRYYAIPTAPDGEATVPEGKATVPEGIASVPDGEAVAREGKATVPEGIAVGREGKLTSVFQSQSEAAQWSFVRLSDEELETFLVLKSSRNLEMLLGECAPLYNMLGKGRYEADVESRFAAEYNAAMGLKEKGGAQGELERAYSSLYAALQELKAARLYPDGSALGDLAAYLKAIEPAMPHISATYYEEKAVEALRVAYDAAKEAVEKENLEEDGYAQALNTLQQAYAAVDYVPGGYYPRLDPTKITDGTEVMLESAASRYILGSYMRPGTVTMGNNSTIYADGRNDSCVWRFVDAGKRDIANGLTTYFLLNKATGLYLGLDAGNQKILTADPAQAMNFSVLTAADIKFTNYLDGSTGADSLSIALQYSKNKTDFVRLGCFPAYGDYVFPVTTASWTHVIAWNVYSAVLSDDIRGEYREAMQTYGHLNIFSGDDPGSLAPQVVENYAEALDFARSQAHEMQRRSLRTAIDTLRRAYDAALAADYKEISEGYYYIVSAFDAFREDSLVKGVGVSQETLVWRDMDYANPENIFRFTQQSDGNFYIQSYYNARYVGTDQTPVALTAKALTPQHFSYVGGGEFAWSNATSANTYYPDNYISDNGTIRSAKATKKRAAVDAWRLKRVPQSVFDSIAVERATHLLEGTLVIEDLKREEGDTAALLPIRMNWILAQARVAGQLNIMAIDVRNATLAEDCTPEALLAVSSQPNCIIYANADQNLAGKNIVVGGNCEELRLEDAPFRCPESFTAVDASLTLTPVYATKSGGWQTVVVPFEVGSIEASTKGSLAFETQSQSGDVMVRAFTGISDGVIEFSKLSEARMEAYTPYALAVPGSSFGARSLAGQEIAFRGENVRISVSDSARSVTRGNYSFVPKLDNRPVSRAWLINYEGNGFEVWANGTPLTLRGYFTCADTSLYKQGAFTFTREDATAAKSKRILSIEGLALDDAPTGIDDLSDSQSDITTAPTKGGLTISAQSDTILRITDLQGRIIFNQSLCGSRFIALPAGIYIVNGKKLQIK